MLRGDHISTVRPRRRAAGVSQTASRQRYNATVLVGVPFALLAHERKLSALRKRNDACDTEIMPSGTSRSLNCYSRKAKPYVQGAKRGQTCAGVARYGAEVHFRAADIVVASRA